MVTSRLPGFYKLPLSERRRIAAEVLGVDLQTLEAAVGLGGMDAPRADKMIENVVGIYAMPFALGLNVQMNGRDYLVPMVVEEPSVVAAASNAAKIIRKGGGFEAEVDPPIMIAQVQLDLVPDPEAARARILDARDELLALADRAVPNLIERGGGARGVEVRDLADGWLVVHILVDCRDAMGANLVNTVAEQLSPRLVALSGGRQGLRILSNLSDRRNVKVRCAIPPASLAFDRYRGDDVRDRIVRASEFAERDPYRASTHNKGIMNGIDPVVIATGNDWRAVEAGAHAYAARDGQYRPLCTWRRGDDGTLVGDLEVPLALGTVGGTLRVHDGARFGLQVAGVESAQELAALAACAGVASNLASLRALATDGIQRGHMALHARTVAIAAGAQGAQVEVVADAIVRAGRVTVAMAREVLAASTTARDAEAAPANAQAAR